MSYKACFTAFLLLFPSVSNADPSAVSVKPPTLAVALAAARPPEKGIALAAGADRIALPVGAPTLNIPATVAQIAAAYGGITQDFGSVTAVAPPVITLLNPDPHDPNIYDGMGREDALTQLAASLDDAQWQALTSVSGLGMNDLATDTQHQLFLALFPSGKLVLHHPLSDAQKEQAYLDTADAGGGPDQADTALASLDQTTWRDMSGSVPQARLRLGHHTVLGIGDNQVDTTQDPAAPPRWEIVTDAAVRDTFYGATVRVTVPNTLKKSDLDFDSDVWKAAVPLAGSVTVGDLIAVIAHATGRELYADHRWEGKRLTLTRSASSAPAHDLLRALALCLGGTYRRVGPAFVLTYDQTGIGTIRQRWVEFQNEALAMTIAQNNASQGKVAAAHSRQDLALSRDPLEMTSDQQKTAAGMGGIAGQLTLAQLSPAQQSLARRFVAQRRRLKTEETALMQEHPNYTEGLPMSTQVPILCDRFEVYPAPQFELLLPGLSDPVNLRANMIMESLFAPPASPSAASDPMEGPPLTAPALAALLQTVPRRAVLAHPRTPADVDTLIVLMGKARMNTLCLDVFSQGVSHLTGSPNILDEAMAKTKGTRIAVFPVLDLFDWGETAPNAVQDQNILGDNSAAAQARDAARRPHTPAQAASLLVSPGADTVQQALREAVRQSARDGIGGMLWREAAVPGYSEKDHPDTLALGYTEDARLSFLRRTHVDPVDISLTTRLDHADLSLTAFDGTGDDPGLTAQWRKARADTQNALLRSLHSAAGPLPIFVERIPRQKYAEDWYGTWDNPDLPLPTGDQPLGSWEQAHAQSHLTLRVLSPQDLLTPLLGASLTDEFQQGHWSGFLLDADAPRLGAPGAVSTDKAPALTESLRQIAKILASDQ